MPHVANMLNYIMYSSKVANMLHLRGEGHWKHSASTSEWELLGVFFFFPHVDISSSSHICQPGCLVWYTAFWFYLTVMLMIILALSDYQAGLVSPNSCGTRQTAGVQELADVQNWSSVTCRRRRGSCSRWWFFFFLVNRNMWESCCWCRRALLVKT